MRSVLSILFLISVDAWAQSVLAAKAGLVLIAEGTVTLDDSPFTDGRGRYRDIPEGSLFRTGEGRAEILLAPGVFLWIGPSSAIRVVRTALADAQIEFLGGSAIVEALDPLFDNSVTLLCGEWRVELPGHGSYRVDSGPATLRQASGDVKLTRNGEAMLLSEHYELAFSSAEISRNNPPESDALDKWAAGRSRALASDTQARLRRLNPVKKGRWSGIFQAVGLPTPGRTY